MKPLLISTGEPAGIGPDICLSLTQTSIPVVLLGDIDMLKARAKYLGKNINLQHYNPAKPYKLIENTLWVHSLPCMTKVQPGQLNAQNASYVLSLLKYAVSACQAQHFSGLVTAPIHKGIINEAGITFTGHTEYLAHLCQVETVVMMLASPLMKVALISTHLPLKEVPNFITKERIKSTIMIVHQALKKDFGLTSPHLKVAGLNPHAGEDGHLGTEELNIIYPALVELQALGMDVQGPYPADTMFNPTNLDVTDVFIAMYHDQGLTVLKHTSFQQAVNITLGLPIIRTSVDHGTALNLAGTNQAQPQSLFAAIEMAANMAKIDVN